jgi:hypothetical protein
MCAAAKRCDEPAVEADVLQVTQKNGWTLLQHRPLRERQQRADRALSLDGEFALGIGVRIDKLNTAILRPANTTF